MTNERGLEPYLVNALDARGVTMEQHETKMRNLAALGPVVLKVLAHNRYTVNGREGFYNPYTDTWSQE